MSNLDFQQIDQLHSEWCKMDKTAKLGLLTKEKIRLNGLVNQMNQYVSMRGGLMNEGERAYAHKLLEMINSVDAEGTKVINELRDDAFKELMKSLMLSNR